MITNKQNYRMYSPKGISKIIQSTTQDFKSSFTKHFIAYQEDLANILSSYFKIEKQKILKIIQNVEININDEKHIQESVKEVLLNSSVQDDVSKDVIIIKNYTSQSHAIFGNTILIKDTILKKLNLKFNSHLDFGAGWIFKLDVYDLLIQKLEENNVCYKILSREEMNITKQPEYRKCELYPNYIEIDRKDGKIWVGEKKKNNIVIHGLLDEDNLAPLSEIDKKEIIKEGFTY